MQCYRAALKPLKRKDAVYLRHVGDLLLDVLVRDRLLLHLVSQLRQRLLKGVGFPLGLMNVRQGGVSETRTGRDEGGEKQQSSKA